MKKAVGLWIDHRKAVIVAVTDQGDATSLIVSGVEKQRGRVAGVRSTAPFASRLVPADDRQESSFHGHLCDGTTMPSLRLSGMRSRFSSSGLAKPRPSCSNVSRRTGSADASSGPGQRNKMTDRQIEAKVRERFAP